jgi:hypothetical protein
MLFVPSRGGISHSSAEDTSWRDLAVGVRALDALLRSTLPWASLRSCGQSGPEAPATGDIAPGDRRP